MSSVNKAIIIGRLGADPVLRTTPSGTSVCNFNVATNETWADATGKKQEKTEWHHIVVWGKNAENCGKFLSKGREVYVEGALQTRQWEDKDKIKRYSTEINAVSVQFLGSKAEGSSAEAPARTASPATEYTPDDVPF